MTKPTVERVAVLSVSGAERRLLIEYGLDPEQILLCRARLDLKQPYSSKLVYTKLAKLERLAQAFERAADRVNSLGAELTNMGISVPSYIPESIGRGPHKCNTFQWDPATGQWGYNQPSPIERTAEEYRQRPVKPQALAAWNQFLVGFKRPPERLFRERGGEYCAEYRDVQQKIIRMPLSRILVFESAESDE